MALSDPDTTRAAWIALGLVLAAALLFVLYAFVGTFVFGVFVYYATRPVYERLRRRISPPSLAAAVSLFLLALPALLLLAYALAVGLQEFQRLAESGAIDLGPLVPLIEPYLDVSGIVRDPAALLDDPNLREAISVGLREGLAYLGFVGNALLHLFVILALAFYLLRDGPRLSRWVRGRAGGDRVLFDAYARAVDADLAAVFFGNILNAILTGIIGVLAYALLNEVAPPDAAIPYPALVGLLTGVASLVPVVGMKLVYVPLTGYLLVRAAAVGEGFWFVAAFFAVSFVVVDAIPDFVLRPYVSGRNLHVGSVMFAYIFGPLLFGWYGIFLGPMLLVLTYHFAVLVLPELLGEGTVRPAAVDPAVEPERTDADPAVSDPAAQSPPDAEAETRTGTDAGTVPSDR